MNANIRMVMLLVFALLAISPATSSAQTQQQGALQSQCARLEIVSPGGNYPQNLEIAIHFLCDGVKYTLLNSDGSTKFSTLRSAGSEDLYHDAINDNPSFWGDYKRCTLIGNMEVKCEYLCHQCASQWGIAKVDDNADVTVGNVGHGTPRSTREGLTATTSTQSQARTNPDNQNDPTVASFKAAVAANRAALSRNRAARDQLVTRDAVQCVQTLHDGNNTRLQNVCASKIEVRFCTLSPGTTYYTGSTAYCRPTSGSGEVTINPGGIALISVYHEDAASRLWLGACMFDDRDPELTPYITFFGDGRQFTCRF